MPVAHSHLLQLLLDAESPIRIAAGDGRRAAAECLHDLGLLDYRKSGWWGLNETGWRFVGGSMDPDTFLFRLRERAERTLKAPVPPGRRSAAEAKRLRRVASSARAILAWLEAGRA